MRASGDATPRPMASAFPRCSDLAASRSRPSCAASLFTRAGSRPTTAAVHARARKVGQKRPAESCRVSRHGGVFAFPDLARLKFFYTRCRICVMFFRRVVHRIGRLQDPRIEGKRWLQRSARAEPRKRPLSAVPRRRRSRQEPHSSLGTAGLLPSDLKLRGSPVGFHGNEIFAPSVMAAVKDWASASAAIFRVMNTRRVRRSGSGQARSSSGGWNTC